MKTLPHKDRGHALCSASSSSRWMNCPGSVGLCAEGPKEEGSKYAEEGTLAHEMAERWLKAWMEGGKHGVSVTNAKEEEMFNHVSSYVRHVKEKAAEFDSIPNIRLETQLVLNSDLNMWGTADVAMTGMRGGKAHGKIIDLKYGKTKVVVKNNSQLAYYAAALLKTSSKKLKDIEVDIFQPRISKSETSIIYTNIELEEWHKKLSSACNKAMLQMIHFNERQYVIGDWCKWCSAKTICPERLRPSDDDASEFL